MQKRYPTDVYLKSPQKLEYGDFKKELSGSDKMLTKATHALQAHMRDVTEKTKQTCYKIPMKESNHVIPTDTPSSLPPESMVHNGYHNNVQYIMDKKHGITYMKGKLLGKVSGIYSAVINITMA